MFVVHICYTHCFVMTWEEIKVSKMFVYFFRIKPLPHSHPANKMIAVHIIMMLSCCAE